MGATLLVAVKKSLRISADIFDDDLTELIEAAKNDLKMRGVDNIGEDAPLVRQAVKLYCRGNFANGDVKERELYQSRYLDLAGAMSLCGFYEGGDEP
mgnify:CR=1 FL=1|jgi:hypothetical protein|nr:MAG TPA: tail connector protein [Caudoviricetes sp.]DAZ50285.1 MAG TPA: tail connector protein [Caudoviricetes sp.]